MNFELVKNREKINHEPANFFYPNEGKHDISEKRKCLKSENVNSIIIVSGGKYKCKCHLSEITIDL